MSIIVMYHYVRDFQNSRYPDINGISHKKFIHQVEYLAQHYTMVSLSDVIEHFKGNQTLQANSCLLSFDDGLIDHYHYAFPTLYKKGIPAAFFPSVDPSLNQRALDIQKLHVLTATVDDSEKICKRLFEYLNAYRSEHDIPSEEALRNQFQKANRFYSQDVMLYKNLLQKGLAKPIRQALSSKLFEEFIGIQESIFVQEFYMSIDHMQTMLKAGMSFGTHGSNHDWLSWLDPNQQDKDILEGKDLLRHINPSCLNDWSMCYPYGDYNQVTKELLEKHECQLALTIQPGKIEESPNRFECRRVDTIDIEDGYES